MALGVSVDPAAIKGQWLGDIAMVHSAAEGGVVGGVTLRMRRCGSVMVSQTTATARPGRAKTSATGTRICPA